MADAPSHAPILNPLPWGVWFLVLAIAGVELVLWAGAHGLVNWAGSAGWRAQAVMALGITPDLQHWMIETRQTPAQHIARYLGFSFVHLGPLQAALVIVITAALGKACAGALGSARVLMILALAQVAGGFAFGAVGPSGAWLIGGYPLIFALAGCYGAAVYIGPDDARAKRQAAILVAVLLSARLLLAIFIGGGMDWVADCVACAAAFFATFILRPGLRARIRRA